MNESDVLDVKKSIIAIGHLMWEKDLCTGLNGNISSRVDQERIVLTATKTCLGLLHEKDLLLMTTDGRLLEDGVASSEKMLHTEIYKNFPAVKAVIHTHTTFTNAFFLNNDTLTPQIFETKLYLGQIGAIEQHTPSVTDIAPVIEALRQNNIVVLKNHGVLAVGQDLFDCFLLIQGLEEAVKIDCISRLYKMNPARSTAFQTPEAKNRPALDLAGQKRFKLFSGEQMAEISRLVNADSKMAEMGIKTQMTMELGVKLDETGQVFSFKFENGRITSVGANEKAEFLISAPEKIWRAVFSRQLDPFVATTQKTMKLAGDFARISKWYAPCSRIFEIWQQVPVE
jgi:L-fuculose-phosphate aldolase